MMDVQHGNRQRWDCPVCGARLLDVNTEEVFGRRGEALHASIGPEEVVLLGPSALAALRVERATLIEGMLRRAVEHHECEHPIRWRLFKLRWRRVLVSPS